MSLYSLSRGDAPKHRWWSLDGRELWGCAIGSIQGNRS
jgi:hypothetical protein